MSAVTLMNAADPWFNFEHSQAHQRMLAKQVQVSSPNFSSTPYWIDPPYGDTSVPAGWENTLHTAYHASFLDLFASSYGGSGVASLNDISLYPEPSAWWQFSNFQLHLEANQLD